MTAASQWRPSTHPSTRVAEAIARATDRLKRFPAERAVDLLTQPTDEHIDHVRAALISLIPGALDQLQPREHLAGPAHERRQYHELTRRQIKLGLPAPNPLGGAIQPQVTNHQLRWARHRTPAGERPPG